MDKALLYEMKTKYTLYNFIFGITNYAVAVILGLINRKALVCYLGIEYQGLNGLFSNVLSMLSIAELGFGTAIIYHLYQALANSDLELTKSLMQFYKKCYTLIALIITLLGFLIIPFLHFIVGEVTLPVNVTLVYLCFLADTVISYLFTYKRSILIANQQNYIVTFCDILYQFAVKLLQIVALVITKDYMAFLAVMIVCRAAENICINFIANRQYRYLNDSEVEKLSPSVLADIRQKVSGTIFHKIGGFVVLGSSNLIITKFLGLAIVGIYSNYFLVINTLNQICSQLTMAATASIGHLLAEHNLKRSNEVFDEIYLLNFGIITTAAAGVFCVATPLISLVFGSKLTLSEPVLFVFALNFYQQGMRKPYAVFKEAAGILYEDRYVPLVESAVSIIASVYLVQKIGLAGVFIGTIISSFLLFGYTYPILVYKGLLQRSLAAYLGRNLQCLLIAVACMGTAKFLCMSFSAQNILLEILFNCIIVCVVCGLMVFVFYALGKTEFLRLKLRVQKIFIKK